MDNHFQNDKKHDFDLEVVYEALIRCAQDGDNVDLVEYLAAYRELCRFFKLTGRLFGFVAKDLEGKISLIEQKQSRESKHREQYLTVQSMLLFEVRSSLANNKGHKVSGSRPLLRLHWALEFILEFMSRIRQCTDDDRTSVIASEVYGKTLANHHPWITRKMASLAIYFLPTRRELINVMCKQDYDAVLQLLEKVVRAGTVVYNKTEKEFAKYDLLNIS